MIHMSLPYIFQLAASLEPIATIPQDKPIKAHLLMYELYAAESALLTLNQNSLFAPYLRSSRQLADEFLDQIKRLIPETPESYEREIASYELFALKQAYDRYKIALLAEIGAFQAFFVTQKRGFDTLTLLNWGENIFPFEMASKVPESLFDAREACRCLAFERPTAAGFHIFRATETVIRRYYAQVTGGRAPPKIRSLGVYLKAMKDEADPKVWTALDQLIKLHRNPVVHPEHVLTMDEAATIFGLAQSAVSAMLTHLPVVPPTTSTAPTGAAAP